MTPHPPAHPLELKVPPLLVAFATAGMMWWLAELLPSLVMTIPWRGGFVVTVCGIGILCVLAGAYEFRRVKTTINPTKPTTTSTIVTAGIYHRSRNPMYVGMLMVLVGWAIALAHPLSLLFLPLFVTYINRFQIIPEERVLAGRFGTEYERYRESVRRWL